MSNKRSKQQNAKGLKFRDNKWMPAKKADELTASRAKEKESDRTTIFS